MTPHEATGAGAYLAAGQLEGTAQAGAKAYRLKQLMDNGLRVPPFFCVPVSLFLAHPALSDDIAQEVAGALQQGLDAYCRAHFPHTALFSVRSSAVEEDGGEASFAGQYQSLLRVPREGLGAAVVQCWLSAGGQGVALYQSRRRPGAGAAMGVVIQEMIESDCSGVAFSVNPQGLLNEAVVVCGASTGDRVVEEKTPVTSYYYNTTDDLYYYERDGESPLLPEPVFHRLVAALKLLGADGPVDIEYAVRGGELYFLQLRPVTALPAETPLVLDNSNIVENYGGLTLPLSASFAAYVYTQVFTGLARRCMPGEAVVREYSPVLGQMVACANGRMYYQISNWYTILKFLPFQKKIVPIWQRMLGVKNKQYNASANPVSPVQRLQTYRRILASVVGIPRKMRALEQDYLAAQALFDSQFSPQLDNKQLVALFIRLADIVLKNWDVTLLNDLYAFVYTSLLEGQLKKAGYADYKQRSNALLAGSHTLDSMAPVQEAMRLARQVAQDPLLQARLEALDSDAAARSWLAAEETPFGRQVRQYLDQYGDRCNEELKLETNTFKSAPLGFVALLLSYAGQGAPEGNTAGKAPESEAALLSGIRRRRWQIRLCRRKAALGIANRETSRLNRGRIFGMVRLIFLQMGEHLHKDGLLAEPRDVLYLTMEELFAVAEGAPAAQDFHSVVARRKEDYRGYAQLPPYSRLVFAGRAFNKHPRQAGGSAPPAAGGALRGTPCAHGVAEGEVLVATGPVTPAMARGKILVARSTDPGWIFLLAVARGIITERGSLLSHAAIVSRELGIPSVVGVEHATALLATGEKIRMDGGKGTIERL